MTYQIKGIVKKGPAKGRTRIVHAGGSSITFETKKEAEGGKKVLLKRLSPTKRKRFGFKVIKK